MEHSKEVQDALHLLERALSAISAGVAYPPDAWFNITWIDVTTLDSELHTYIPRVTLEVTQKKDVRL